MNQEKCYSCAGKGTYSQMHGEEGFADFGGEGYENKPSIHNYPCKACNGTGFKPEVTNQEQEKNYSICTCGEPHISKRITHCYNGKPCYVTDSVASPEVPEWDSSLENLFNKAVKICLMFVRGEIGEKQRDMKLNHLDMEGKKIIREALVKCRNQTLEKATEALEKEKKKQHRNCADVMCEFCFNVNINNECVESAQATIRSLITK